MNVVHGAQGQHVRHLAKRAISPHGRITMVTGYIPADPMLSDQTVLRVSKMMSNLPTLFHQWAQYRLERFGKQAQLISQVSISQVTLQYWQASVSSRGGHQS